MRKSLLALVSLVAALAAAVSLVSGAFAQSRTTPSVVHFTAKKSGLAFTTKTATAAAGKIKIVFTNLSPIKHNVRLEIGEKEYGGTKTIAMGSTTAYVTLKAGKYHFYCSVPGHEEAGMSGYLTVR